MSPTTTDPNDALWVFCLCAEWCNTCREWHAVTDQVAAEHPGVRWGWIDIEDEADLLDPFDIDIETFPTLLVGRRDRALFFGPIPAQGEVMSRLIDSLKTDNRPRSGTGPQADALWRALQSRRA